MGWCPIFLLQAVKRGRRSHLSSLPLGCNTLIIYKSLHRNWICLQEHGFFPNEEKAKPTMATPNTLVCNLQLRRTLKIFAIFEKMEKFDSFWCFVSYSAVFTLLSRCFLLSFWCHFSLFLDDFEHYRPILTVFFSNLKSEKGADSHLEMILGAF